MSSVEQEIERLSETRDLDLEPSGPGDEFCHILDASLKSYYCGKTPVERGPTCQRYAGEAICPTCGRPTCPTCAVRSDLAVRLEGT